MVNLYNLKKVTSIVEYKVANYEKDILINTFNTICGGTNDKKRK